MRKYYTRACNFYHGRIAKSLTQSKKALPLNGKKDLAFDSIEIFIRQGRRVKSNLISKFCIPSLDIGLHSISLLEFSYN